MATLRGRAAQPLRPGFIVKAVLSGDIPLTSGEIVRQASITDVHQVYKYLTRQENITRPREKRLKGMSYLSFITMFRFARYMGLVEKVREEAMLFPPPGDPLLSIRKPDDVPEVVESKRVVYQLTKAGVEDEVAWSNLRKAWAEGWPVPQKAKEYAPTPPPTYVEPAKPEVPVEKVKVAKLKRPKLAETPSVTQFRKLLSYLKSIQASGLGAKEIAKELYDVSGATSDWAVAIEDAMEAARRTGQKARLETLAKWNRYISEMAEGFLDDDLPRIIAALEEVV